MSKFLDSNGLVFFKTLVENFVNNGFVAKVSGKGLSTNDYTTAEKDKLAGITAGAEPNVNSDWNATSGDAQILNKPTIPTSLAGLSADSSHRTVSDAEKAAWNAKSDFSGSYNDLANKPTIPTTVASLSDASDYAKKTDLTNVYTYKGSVASVAKLPTNAAKGDVYNVESDGANYAWNGTEWDSLGGSFTVTAITNAEIEAMFA